MARFRSRGCGESPSLSCGLISLPLPVRRLLIMLFSGSQTSSGSPLSPEPVSKVCPCSSPAFKATTLHTHEDRKKQWPSGENPQPSCPCRRTCEMEASWKTAWKLQEIKYRLPCDPAISVLSAKRTESRNLNTHLHDCVHSGVVHNSDRRTYLCPATHKRTATGAICR